MVCASTRSGKGLPPSYGVGFACGPACQCQAVRAVREDDSRLRYGDCNGDDASLRVADRYGRRPCAVGFDGEGAYARSEYRGRDDGCVAVVDDVVTCAPVDVDEVGCACRQGQVALCVCVQYFRCRYVYRDRDRCACSVLEGDRRRSSAFACYDEFPIRRSRWRYFWLLSRCCSGLCRVLLLPIR